MKEKTNPLDLEGLLHLLKFEEHKLVGGISVSVVLRIKDEFKCPIHDPGWVAGSP